MKSFDTELAKYAQKTKLKVAEREALRQRILSYMEYHPLSKQTENLAKEITSEPFTTLRVDTIYTRVVTGIFLMLFLIVLPFAAEKSVPGDVLYLIKTGVNENIRAQFATSPYEKIAYETSLMERRIAEARLLAKEGKLSEEVEAQIAETVKNHANAAQKGIEELKESDADEGAIAEITFGSALDVQSAVLDSDRGEESASSTDGIAGAVRAAKERSVSEKGSTTPSYERLMARVETETTRAYELFETINGSATTEEKASVERRFDDIERDISDAQAARESSEPAAGVPKLVHALGAIQKLISFMTDIDVRESVTLDTLVPIVLTKEERRAVADELFEDVETRFETVKLKVEEVEDEDLLEKVSFGIERLTELVNTATSSRGEGDISAYEQAIKEAGALLDDVEVLLQDVTVEVMERTEEDTGTTTKEIETGGEVEGTTTSTGSTTVEEIGIIFE